jgi:hypothetical protein
VAPEHQRCREPSLHPVECAQVFQHLGDEVVGLRDLLCGDLLELQPPQRTNTVAGLNCNASCMVLSSRHITARIEGGQ